MKKHLYLATILCWLPFDGTYAQQLSAVEKLSYEQCNISDVVNMYSLEASERSAEQTARMDELLNIFMEINSKAKVPDMPVGDQLEPDDLKIFEKTNNELSKIRIGVYVESDRSRDTNFLAEMVRFADAENRFSKVPNENDPDYFYYQILLALRKYTPQQIQDHTDFNKICSFDTAINKLEIAAKSELNQSNPIKPISIINRLKKKYAVSDIDGVKLSVEDTKIMVDANRSLAPSIRNYSYVKDLEYIKLMNKSSELIYKMRKKDLNDGIVNGNDDLQHLGDSLDKLNAAGKIDKNTQYAIQLWQTINEKIPNDYIKIIKVIIKAAAK